MNRARCERTPAQISFLANRVRLYRGEVLDLTLSGGEASAQLEKLLGKKPKFGEVPCLCRATSLNKIEAQGWSLNPGRYVGVATFEAVSVEDFKEQLQSRHAPRLHGKPACRAARHRVFREA